MSSDPKPVGGQWHKAARGELSPPKGASEETLVPQLFTASVPDPRTVQNLGVSPCSRGIRTQWVWTGEEIRALDDGQASSTKF